MTSKERRQLKHNLKLMVDEVDCGISLLDMAVRSVGGVPKEQDKKRDVVKVLEEGKKNLQETFSQYLAEIDSYIEKFSK